MSRADRASARQCVAGGGTAKPLFALAGWTGAGWTKPEPEAGVGAGTTKPEPAAGPELDAAVVVGVGDAALCATRLFP